MIRLLSQARYLLLTLVITACVLLFPQVKKALVVDNSLDIWFLQEDPALLNYKQYKSLFGNDEVIVMIVRDEAGLISHKYNRLFPALTAALEARPEVHRVLGPGNAKVIEKDELGFFSQPLLSPGSASSEIKKRLAAIPLLKNQLYSPDYKTARFIITPGNITDFENRRGEILQAIKNTVSRHLNNDQTFYGGVGIIYTELNKLSEKDFGFFLFSGYALMFLVLSLLHRSPLAVLYAIATVALSTWLTFGVYGACGFRLNLMTILLPMIFILLGVMDIMHVLNEYALVTKASGTDRERALKALSAVFKPCLLTSLTTMAGFLAALSSPMPILKTFGVFAAIGVGFCFVFTYLLGVILLPSIRSKNYSTKVAARLSTTLAELVVRKQKLFSLISIALVVFCCLGIFKLKSDTYTLGYFPPKNKVVTDNHRIEDTWGAYMPLEFTIEPKAGFSLKDPQLVMAAKDFETEVKKLKGVERVLGFHSFYEGILQSEHGEKTDIAIQSKGAVKLADRTFQRFYPDLYPQFISGKTGRITISGHMTSAMSLSKKLDTIGTIAANTLEKYARVEPAGYQPMYTSIVKYVTTSQINSFVLSLLVVAALIMIYLKNIRLAIIALIPNIIPILIMFGIMGWFGIYIDTATASIAAIILGIAIDDTIHYIYHYNTLKKGGRTAAEARRLTAGHVLPAVILTAILLTSGYSFMLFASLKTVQLFGLLTSIALIAGLFSELLIFPLLLHRFDTD
ncbi:RND family transporter [Pedobacter sp. SYSU D00535]|uniref:efflux RND transporter permease subunit n=1 Tax=Pedobacter sp. SYSU D00535 TaxID=2810308 RepID=UPI001A9761A4|nr:MMPL family transporter [Pedobacter sp. SYSU D00535]